jgi:hypothetical protein
VGQCEVCGTGGSVILPIPYRSQLAEDAGYGRGDCGPASLAMILLALSVYITVDALGKVLQKPAQYTTSTMRELQQLAREFRIDLEYRGKMTLADVRRCIEARQAIIALVWYPKLPNRYDPAYRNGHFVVIVGVEGDTIIYHDPYYRGSGGALLRASWADFSKGWSATGNGAFNVERQGLIAPPLPMPQPTLDTEGIKAIRWHAEEGVRAFEQGNGERARRIMLDEVIARLYALEGVA